MCANLLHRHTRRLGRGLAWLALAAVPAAGWSQTPAAPPAYGPDEKPDQPGVTWAPAATGNFATANRPASRAVDMVIIHDIEGPADFAVHWFQNPVSKVSSHYVIGEDGHVWQQVKERDVAWHAGNSDTNGRSIGIEHSGFAYRPGFFNAEEYEASARLVRDITNRYGIPRDRTHIIAHAEVPNPADPTKFGGRSGHTDPGPYWDWDYYMALVRNDARVGEVQLPSVIHPGEKLTARVALGNSGDDAWPFYQGAEKAAEVRSRGPVYLAVRPSAPEPLRTQSPLYDSATWTSPRFIGGAAGAADVAPGDTATFSFTLRGPRELGTATEQLRLVKVPTAPRMPVPFGPAIPVSVRVEPWELDVGTAGPQFAAPGWLTENRAGRDVRTQKWDRKTRDVAPARWSTPLPIDGVWQVEARWSGKGSRAKHAVYEIATAEGTQRVTVDQRKHGGEWNNLGRFHFAGAKPTAVVSLSADPQKGGTVEADAIRLVGPFPEGSDNRPTSAR